MMLYVALKRYRSSELKFVTEGFGYLETFPDINILKKIVWTNDSITLSADTNNYLYYNQSNILSTSTSQPKTIFNILLGRVVTNSIGIEFIDASPLTAEHNGNRLSDLARNAFGSIYVSGSIVNERKMGISRKNIPAWNKNKESTIISKYKNMSKHLRFDIDIEWLLQFKDIFLNASTTLSMV